MQSLEVDSNLHSRGGYASINENEQFAVKSGRNIAAKRKFGLNTINHDSGPIQMKFKNSATVLNKNKMLNSFVNTNRKNSTVDAEFTYDSKSLTHDKIEVNADASKLIDNEKLKSRFKKHQIKLELRDQQNLPQFSSVMDSVANLRDENQV